jgi:serine/threonine protein phosphatase 1
LTVPQQRIGELIAHARRFGDEAKRLAGVAKDACVRLIDRYMPGRRQAPAPLEPVDYGPPARVPEGRRIYAVGDIHGRSDLLTKLLKDLQADALGGAYKGQPILIFLGDYIDRGLQSKEVIDILMGELVSPFETYFLKGNHEAAMLQFLREPSAGPRWAEFGGAETLASYGVRTPRSRMASEEWAVASAELARVLPPEHLRFLARLQVSVRLGDYLFVHAGVRPGVDLDRQSEYDLLWIRDEFLNDSRPLGVTVVHGHTPATRPYRDARRVGVDTGAYITGRLTAARFEHDTIEFLATGAALESKAATGT